MCAVQLLRVSVHERLNVAVEDVVQQLETTEKAAGEKLRPLLVERLKAVAEEILRLFEKTVEKYEDSLQRSEQKICRQARLLDAVLKPQVRLQRADVQQLLVNKGKVSTEQREMSSGLDPRIKQETEDDGGDCGVLESDISLPPPAADEASRSLCQDGQKPFIHTGAKPFSCVTCKKTFREPAQVKKHKCVYGSQQLTVKPPKCLRCYKCGEEFLEKSLLAAHKKIHVKVKKQKQWLTCTVCGLQRQCPSQIKRHMKQHKRPVVRCSSCGKKFRKKGNLKKHMTVHMTVRPLGCSDCDKRFFWTYHLENHKCPAKPLPSDGPERKRAYTKSETSVEPDDGVDSNFWKDTRQHRSGYIYERKKKISIEERGCDTDSEPLSSPDMIASDPQDDEWFVYECCQETKTLESDLTSVIQMKVCDRNTDRNSYEVSI